MRNFEEILIVGLPQYLFYTNVELLHTELLDPSIMKVKYILSGYYV